MRLVRLVVVFVHLLAAGMFGQQTPPGKPAASERKAPPSLPAPTVNPPTANPTVLSTGLPFISILDKDEVEFLRLEREIQAEEAAQAKAKVSELEAEKKEEAAKQQLRDKATRVGATMKIDFEKFDFDADTNHFVKKKTAQ